VSSSNASRSTRIRSRRTSPDLHKPSRLRNLLSFAQLCAWRY
jgi:hypothetical protein